MTRSHDASPSSSSTRKPPPACRNESRLRQSVRPAYGSVPAHSPGRLATATGLADLGDLPENHPLGDCGQRPNTALLQHVTVPPSGFRDNPSTVLHSRGHWFTDDASRPGQIGPRLPDADKYAIIEFLKVATYESYPAEPRAMPAAMPCQGDKRWALGKASRPNLAPTLARRDRGSVFESH